MLNRSDKNGYPYLFPGLIGKLSDFQWKMLAVGLLIMAFIMLKDIFSIPNFLNSFYNEQMYFNSPVKPSFPGLSLLGDFSITHSFTLLVMGIFRFFISSFFSLFRLYVPKNFSTSRLSSCVFLFLSSSS